MIIEQPEDKQYDAWTSPWLIAAETTTTTHPADLAKWQLRFGLYSSRQALADLPPVTNALGP
jgi:hypothetical protein